MGSAMMKPVFMEAKSSHGKQGGWAREKGVNMCNQMEPELSKFASLK